VIDEHTRNRLADGHRFAADDPPSYENVPRQRPHQFPALAEIGTQRWGVCL